MIAARDVTKRFGAFTALDRVSLDVAQGELVALLGPSGSGKTTLLRVLAGLEAPDGGEVLLDGSDVTVVPPAARRVGFVFQHYALFRHMSVFENVAFGLRVMPRRERPPRAEIERRVKRLLELVRMPGHASRLPSELSGGQRQRVALARALAVEPRVLLLDEPFGALDAKVREELRTWLRRLHDDLKITTVLVTRDQEEAMSVAHRVVVMNEGKVEQAGAPEEIERAPASRFVYEFVGRVNVLEARVRRGRAVVGDAWTLDAPEHADVEDAPAAVYVRPHELELRRAHVGAAGSEVEIRAVRVNGASVRVELARRGAEGDAPPLVAELAHERAQALDLRVGSRCFASLRAARVFLDR